MPPEESPPKPPSENNPSATEPQPVEQIHFVTGRLAERALRAEVDRLANEVGFKCTVQVLPISVAALMTASWIAKHLEVPPNTSRVILPGYCREVSHLEKQFGVKFEVGPKDLRRLSEMFGKSNLTAEGFGKYAIEIIAEINHAPKLTIEELTGQAASLAQDGADIIDIGCFPNDDWLQVGDAVKAVKDLGLRVSIDSLNPSEIQKAAQAGAELVLSVNSTNRESAADWGIEVVAIPDDFEDLAGLNDTIEFLNSKKISFRIDPILEPIGFGFAKSLQRYLQVREKYPAEAMMMGIGNLTELTDCDSAGINTLLLGYCQELEIGSVLTTQVINWARTSVRECDLARRLVYHAIRQGVPPKRLSDSLVVLRDPKLMPYADGFLEQLASQIKDQNFRIFADGSHIHVLGDKQHFRDNDPFEVFDQMLDQDFSSLDPSHSFYLGFEMCKAMIANQLGKEYTQDQALNWGYLTVEEHDRHRLQKRKKKRD